MVVVSREGCEGLGVINGQSCDGDGWGKDGGLVENCSKYSSVIARVVARVIACEYGKVRWLDGLPVPAIKERGDPHGLGFRGPTPE